MAEARQTESVTLRIPSDILSDIDRIAEGTERSRSYIMLRALRGYLMHEGAEILGAMEGRTQLDAGEHEDFDAVLAEMDRLERLDDPLWYERRQIAVRPHPGPADAPAEAVWVYFGSEAGFAAEAASRSSRTVSNTQASPSRRVMASFMARVS